MPSIAFTDLAMTYHDSFDDGIRNLSGNGRSRTLTVGSTASSMDGLWDLHPRRLSEAGLSRHSDSSAVLTEDTDSFMIGQRVWVGGSKPGTIAYIGETQFAPGEWAGIALDGPIGKNDGSVGGIRYFQCENKKGVFSRLTRLTRVPLELPGMGSNETFTPPNNGVRRSPISPTGSTRSLLRSAASLSNSNTSLSSSAHVDFKIGDRVIIKSNQGSKIGTLRYMGLTDFAPGEWVGVELDDPRGKNDGSVEGKRYFECRPNFGLFAPISKASKSPSKHKPSACVVHSGQGLPPSGLKRINSKESMASLASKTSAASSVRRVRLGVTSLSPKKLSPKPSTPLSTRTTLQDVLREKQQHIEQLLKERDLERAEVTRAASQADEAEEQFYSLKQEFEEYRAECEAKVRQNSDILEQMKIDRADLLTQLEDEKRRNEDLQFRFEEAAITKGDIEVLNENYAKKIAQLDQHLTEERQKGEMLELTSNKLFETEENLIKAREEIDSLRSEIEKTRIERSSLEENSAVSSELVNSLQKQVTDANSEIQEKMKIIDTLNEEIANVRSEHDLFKRETEEFEKRSADGCREKDALIEKLKSEVDHQEKNRMELLKENEKLKMELSAKSLDLESANDQIVNKVHEIESLRKELESTKKQLNNQIDTFNSYKIKALDVEHSLKKELEETRDNLKTKISEVEKMKELSDIEISNKNKQLDEANTSMLRNHEEIKKLNDDLNEIKNKFETNVGEIHTRHTRQIASQDTQLMAFSAELQQKNEEITKSSIVISKLEEDLCTKNGIIEKLRLELESYQSQQSGHTEISTTLTHKLNDLSLSNSDLQKQVNVAHQQIAELMLLKQNLEAEIRTLSSKCESMDQLDKLKDEVKVKQHLLDTLKEEYENKLHNSERIRHELEVQQQTITTNFERIRAELELKLQTAMQAEELLKQRCDNSLAEVVRIKDEYRVRIDQLEQSLQEKERALSSIENRLSENTIMYQDQMKLVTENFNRNLQENQQKISALNGEIVQVKEELSKKSEEIIEAHAKTSHLLAQRQQAENELKHKCTEDSRRLEFELNETKMLLERTSTELELLKNDCHSANTDLEVKDQKISALTVEIGQAQKLISQLQDQLTSAQFLHQGTAKEHESVQNQCQDLLEKVASLTAQIQAGEEIFKNLQIEHNNAMELVNLLKITEEQKKNCLKQLQQKVDVNSENKNCNHVMELLNQIKTDNSTENTEKIFALQKDIQNIRNQLAERNHQFDIQQSELLRLQQELLQAQESNAPYVEGNIQEDHNSLIQDRALAENQIKFLNSIIVDIQKKNEEQRARIEILEAGCSPAMADEMKFIGESRRQIPPRMYCDICEEFDLHETEDCPKQNTEVMPSNIQRSQKIMPERPYCEICEQFGHATEDCQEDQTF